MKFHIRLTIIIVLGLVIISLTMAYRIRAFQPGTGTVYSFGSEGVIDAEITSNGDVLYLSYLDDNTIVEINTASMTVIRQISVEWPSFMLLSANEELLYVLSLRGSSSQLIRIDRATGQYDLEEDALELDGEAQDFTMDSIGGRIWIVHRTWPLIGDSFTDFDRDAPDNTGFLTEINLNSYSISSTIPIMSVPSSVYFSPSAQRLFVLHQLYYREYDPDDTSREAYLPEIESDRISIYDVSIPGNMSLQQEELLGGGHQSDLIIMAHLGEFTQTEGKMFIPNPWPFRPEYTMRIADTSNLTYFDLTIEDATGDAIGSKYIQKVSGQNVAWVVAEYGFAYAAPGPGPGIVMRVNTTWPYSLDAFIVEETTNLFGDFAVSPSGDILYLTVPDTGEVIKWIPPQ